MVRKQFVRFQRTWSDPTGDVEIVKILLENGADPYVENDLGMNAFDCCDKAGPFPSVKRALQKHVNETQQEKMK